MRENITVDGKPYGGIWLGRGKYLLECRDANLIVFRGGAGMPVYLPCTTSGRPHAVYQVSISERCFFSFNVSAVFNYHYLYSNVIADDFRRITPN